MTRALHMRRPRQSGEGLDLRVSLCGMVAVDVTDEAVGVTCRLCREALRRTAAAETVPSEVLGVEVPVTPRPRRLSALQRRIVERSIAGEDGEETRSRFRSWAALHEHHARVTDDGCPVRSTSDPGRFGARAMASGGAVRMPSGRDDVIEVDRVLRAATATTRRIGPHVLEQEAQLAIYLARCEGRPLVGRTGPGRKGTLVTRSPMTAAEVAQALGGEWTAHHVGMLVRAIRADAAPIMVRKGILPARAMREEREMRIDGYDLDGWKEIADVVGCSVDTAQRHASARALPVVRLSTGRVIAIRSEIEAWKRRQVSAA